MTTTLDICSSCLISLCRLGHKSICSYCFIIHHYLLDSQAFQFTLLRIMIDSLADGQDPFVSVVHPVPKQPGQKGGCGIYSSFQAAGVVDVIKGIPSTLILLCSSLIHSWQCLSSWLLSLWLILLITFVSTWGQSSSSFLCAPQSQKVANHRTQKTCSAALLRN